MAGQPGEGHTPRRFTLSRATASAATLVSLVLLTPLPGCDDDSAVRNGSHAYECRCDCFGSLGRFVFQTTTCADDHAQAVTNCRTNNGDCEQAVVAAHGGFSWSCDITTEDEVTRSHSEMCEGDYSDDWIEPGDDSGPDSDWATPKSLLASRTPAATFVGFVDPGDSRLRLQSTDDGSEAEVRIFGELSFTGGDCPGEACEIAMEYAYFYAEPFDLGPHRVTELKIMNNGIWAGTKDVTGRFTFEPSQASLNLAGEVDGVYNSLTADASERGVTGELVGIDVLSVTHDGEAAPLRVRPTGAIEFLYPSFFFEGTFSHDVVVAELRIAILLSDGAPYAKAEQRYDPGGQLVLDGSKSSRYKCLWGYCETREGVTTVELPPDSGVEGGEPVSVDVEGRWEDLDFRWIDAEENLLGEELVIFPEETPSYPVTLAVTAERDGIRRMDIDTLQMGPIRPVVYSGPGVIRAVLFVLLILLALYAVYHLVWRRAAAPET